MKHTIIRYLVKLAVGIQEPIKYRVVAQLRPVTKALVKKHHLSLLKVLAKRKAKKVEEKKKR